MSNNELLCFISEFYIPADEKCDLMREVALCEEGNIPDELNQKINAAAFKSYEKEEERFQKEYKKLKKEQDKALKEFAKEYKHLTGETFTW